MTLMEQFEVWKETPGGRHTLRLLYRTVAPYAARYQRTGRRVAIGLIWELLRDRVAWVRRRLAARGVEIERWDGFAFNNNFRAYAARHILSRRPEWDGLFATRKLTNEPQESPQQELV